VTQLNILHISDLHWSTKNAADLKIVRNALISDLDKIDNQYTGNVDIIVFSGDMVQAGGDTAFFRDAYDNFLKPVLSKVNIDQNRLFVAPGNHDICRETVRNLNVIEQGFKSKLVETSVINKFIDAALENALEETLALSRMRYFYEWHDDVFEEYDSIGNFCRTFKVIVGDRSIGIAAFNTAWRATGEPDEVDNKFLMLGERVVDRALQNLEDTDFRIAVLHHPFELFHDEDRNSVEARITSGFDLVCCGHTHGSKPKQTHDVNGSCITSQVGSLFAGREWFNGYQLLSIDLLSFDVRVIVREYYNSRRQFDSANTVCEGGKIEFQARMPNLNRRNQVELFLRENREAIRVYAVKHINFADHSYLSEVKILESFVPPILRKRSESRIDESGNFIESFDRISIDDIINSSESYVFTGDRQSGKSSLKHYIAYKVSKGDCSVPYIPVFIDPESHNFNLYGINRAIASTYGKFPKSFDVNKALENGLFLFFVDDISGFDDEKLKLLNSHMKAFSANRWICFGTPRMDSISRERSFHRTLPAFTVVSIGELNRRAIRQMTNAWFSSPDDEPTKKFDLVMAQLTRDGLPRTAYMVGLLLWAARQGHSSDRLNEAILLQNVVDHLLGRADFSAALRGQLNSTGKELLLQMLAQRMKNETGGVSVVDATGWVRDYFDQKKLAFEADDVLGKLVHCGILNRSNGFINFRFECFREYFSALHFSRDSKARSQAVEGLAFLGNRRELELLSGLEQDNEYLLGAIFDVLDRRMPLKLSATSPASYNLIAELSKESQLKKKRLTEIKKTKLTEEQIDSMMDALDERTNSNGEQSLRSSLKEADGDIVKFAENRQKKQIARDRKECPDHVRLGTFIASLDLLARITRNSDFTDFDIKGPVVEKILSDWVRIFVYMMIEMDAVIETTEKMSENPLSDDELKMLRVILSKMIHGAMGSVVISSMATPALSNTLKELYEKADKRSGEYLLYLYLLEDTNDPSWAKEWSRMLSEKGTTSFAVDVLMDKLWYSVNTKALDEDQRLRVFDVVNVVEKRFNWSNKHKSSVLEEIKDRATLKKLSDD
jgi:predicted MPP superfamily phosphohydrolase